MEAGKMTVQDVAENVIGKLQHLRIDSNYETMKTLCSCLEQMYWIRQEAGKAEKELAALRAERLAQGTDGPGGEM